jgi:CubicO group peptidase (beta-lactamase class C family)
LIAVALCVTVLAPARPASAQALTLSLFERYLTSAWEQSGIPGLSAVIVRGDAVVWERAFGRQDIEGGVAATLDTPYLLGDVGQVFGATLLLKKCVDEGHLDLSDAIQRWVPDYPEPGTTVRQLLSHTAPTGGFSYDSARFSALTGVVEQCASAPYARLLGEEIFSRLGMAQSSPGTAIASLGVATPTRPSLPPATMQHYEAVLRTLARPYRVAGDRASRSEVPQTVAHAAGGIVSSARDLARLDVARRGGVLLERDTLVTAWTQARSGGQPMPTGLGWFVQNYSGEPLVWQFGLHKDAYSSLILKLPNRDLTLILLANSDGLSAPFSLGSGDATASVYARIFLRLFVS